MSPVAWTGHERPDDAFCSRVVAGTRVLRAWLLGALVVACILLAGVIAPVH